MSRNHSKRPAAPAASKLAGPTQRQLRAGELIRHALVEILREEPPRDPAIENVSITVSEVRLSPDLKHAICFVEPLGAGVTGAGNEAEIVKAMNRSTKFLRGRLSRHIDMKFTPDLKFVHDQSFDAATQIDRLFDNPKVQADLAKPDEDEAPLAASRLLPPEGGE